MLSCDQELVLKFLKDNSSNGFYSAKDIHENVFDRAISRKRGFACVKTSNILKALVNKKLVKRRYLNLHYVYTVANN